MKLRGSETGKASLLGLVGGTTAAMGVGMVIFRWIFQRRDDRDFLEWYKQTFWSLFYNTKEVIEDACTPKPKVPQLIDYHGSCHCESVIFKVREHIHTYVGQDAVESFDTQH